MDNRLIGVYAIENLNSGRDYIGSTTVSFYHRWAQHRSQLNAGIHPCRSLQVDWNTLGDIAFEFRIVEVVDDPNRTLMRERYWQGLNIKYCNPQDTYNTGGGAVLAKEMRVGRLRELAIGRSSFEAAYKQVGGSRNDMHREWKKILRDLKTGARKPR